MRIRIQTISPLPSLKAWFTLDSDSSHWIIEDLKQSLCQKLTVLQDAEVQQRDLVLLLDEFELLNDSPIHVVRDGDHIFIKQHVSMQSAPSNKRETVEEGKCGFPFTTCFR